MTFFEFDLSPQDQARIEASQRRSQNRMRMAELARRLREMADRDPRANGFRARRSR